MVRFAHFVLYQKHPTNHCTGDADGLGEVRKKELVKSGLQLGIGSRDDILIIEDKYAYHRI